MDSAEELVKELFPNGITAQEKTGIRKLFRSCCKTDREPRNNFLP